MFLKLFVQTVPDYKVKEKNMHFARPSSVQPAQKMLIYLTCPLDLSPLHEIWKNSK